MYTVEDIKYLKPMSYWAFPSNSSSNQKARFAKAMETGYGLTLKRDGALYRAIVEEDGVILQSRTISRTTGVFVEKQDRVPRDYKSTLEATSRNRFNGRSLLSSRNGET